MNREILFRGQTRRYGEKVRISDGSKVPSHWVYGGVLPGRGCYSIIYGGEYANDTIEGADKFCVYSDTVGQYTGLKDKYGSRIYEGDIIKALDMHDSDFVGSVEFCNNAWCVNGRNWSDSLFMANDLHYIIIIGNIHDNPELLAEVEG